MKAMELRIGNYIENTDSQMASYMVVNADVIKQNEHTMYASLEPILLTEEWLIKFGFKKRDMLSSILFDMKNPRFSIYLNPPIDKSNKWNILGIEKNVNIQYVHQLQNLYFALTGEELTLKP